MRQYDAAIVYHLEIYQRYPDAQEAVIEGNLGASDIYESRLKNIDATIHTLHLIEDNYPDYSGLRNVERRIEKLQKKQQD